MDRDLLEALNNLGLGLERVAEALEKKSGDKDRSSVEEALVSGDFEDNLTRIAEGIEHLKSDTSKILSNQETIIKMQKEQKSGDAGLLGNISTDDGIKDGITTIVMIAGAVMATGLAFKLVGEVDWKTVMSLSISLPLIALSFSKIHSMGMTPTDAFKTSGVILAMSGGIVGASMILEKMEVVSASKMVSAVALSGVFYLLIPAMGKILSSFQGGGMTMAMMVGGMAFLPLVMAGTALALVKASEILGGVKEITNTKLLSTIGIALAFGAASFGIAKLLTGLSTVGAIGLMLTPFALPFVMSQFSLGIKESSVNLAGVTEVENSKLLTVIGIAAAFGIMGYGIGNIVKSLSGVDPLTAVATMMVAPYMFEKLSYAIMESSKYLSKVEDISFSQGLSAIMISGMFVVLSYAIKPMVQGTKDATLEQVALGVSSMVVLAGAVGAASLLLSEIKDISISQGLSAILISGMFVVLSYAIKPMVQGTKDATLKDVALGVSSMVILAGAVGMASVLMADAKIIDMGKTADLTVFALALIGITIPFSLAARRLGKVKLTDLLKGGAAIMGISAVVAASSRILSMGDYGDGAYPDIKWAMGVGASILGFSISMLGLGALISTGAGGVALLVGAGGVLGVSSTIVAASAILNSGVYDKYPSLGWALGVGATLTAFAGIMTVVGSVGMVGGILEKLTFGAIKDPIKAGGQMLEDMSDTILKVDKTLRSGSYDKYPTVDWAGGISELLIAVAGAMKNTGGVTRGDMVRLNNILKSVSDIDSMLSKGDFRYMVPKEWSESLKEVVDNMLLIYNSGLKEMGMFELSIINSKMRMVFDNIRYGGEQMKGVEFPSVGGSDGFFSVVERFTGLMAEVKWSNILGGMGMRYIVNDIAWSVKRLKDVDFGGLDTLRTSMGFLMDIKELMVVMGKVSTNSFEWVEHMRTLSDSFGDNMRGEMSKTIISVNNLQNSVSGLVDVLGVLTRMDSLSKVGSEVGHAFDWVDGFVTDDKLVKMVTGIDMMSMSFDRLGNSMGRFVNGVDMLELGKLESLRTLSSNMVFFSMMDVEQFNRVMEGIEAKSEVFAGLVRDINFTPAATFTPSVITVGGAGGQTANVEMTEVVERLDAAVALLSQLVSTLLPMKTHLMSKKDKQLSV